MPCIKLLLLLLVTRMCRNKLYLIVNEKGNYTIETENNHKSDHDLDLEFPERNCHNEIMELNNKIKKLEETVTNLKKAKSNDGKFGGKNIRISRSIMHYF